jgi:hypothetical protein
MERILKLIKPVKNHLNKIIFLNKEIIIYYKKI